MLEDFRLKVFLAVAREKSFTKAADRLSVSQPAVSQNISELEKSLGCRLFQRLRGETPLTPEGEVFVRYAMNILQASSDAELLFSPADVSEVRICASDEIYTYYIIKELKDYIAVHPEVSFVRTGSDGCDILVSVKSAGVEGRPSCIELVYKPTQAFALTKTCMVLKKLLKF